MGVRVCGMCMVIAMDLARISFFLMLYIHFGLSIVYSSDYMDCPPQFLQYNENICVGISSTFATAGNAKNACKDSIGSLPGEIMPYIGRDMDLNAFTKEIQWTVDEYWIGLTSTGKEGMYVWYDGETTPYHQWGSSNPSDDLGNEKQCVIMDKKNWVDKKCSLTYGRFCQYTQVNATDLCPPGFLQMPQSSLCYSWSSEKNEFSKSRQLCSNSASGKPGLADLASIHTNEIWKFVTGQFHPVSGWIGLLDDTTAFHYRWLNNETLDYPLWMLMLKDFEAESYSEPPCVAWDWGSAEWAERNCSEPKKVLCQYTLPSVSPFFELSDAKLCEIPQNFSSYPVVEQVSDGNEESCKAVDKQTFLVQAMNLVVRKPVIVVVSNISCEPQFGIIVGVKPKCDQGKSCEMRNCFPGVPEILSRNLTKCTYKCLGFTEPKIGLIFIAFNKAARVCEIYMT